MTLPLPQLYKVPSSLAVLLWLWQEAAHKGLTIHTRRERIAAGIGARKLGTVTAALKVLASQGLIRCRARVKTNAAGRCIGKTLQVSLRISRSNGLWLSRLSERIGRLNGTSVKRSSEGISRLNGTCLSKERDGDGGTAFQPSAAPAKGSEDPAAERKILSPDEVARRLAKATKGGDE